MDTRARLKYLVWAGARFLVAETSCPACSEVKTVRLRRKYLVTSLYRCPSCELMFRVPKPTVEECDEFYQSDYTQGFTTDCPGPEELKKLQESSFAGTSKDYSDYIRVLRAIALEPRSTILDYGCSWGYGSWQLARAGYKVYSYEISRPRAAYAEQKLDCELRVPAELLSEKVDCMFSAHVIEHLTNPREIWDIARQIVKPGGRVVFFCPNGSPQRESLDPHYHKKWGQVHPLVISPAAARRMGEAFGFTVRCYSLPYQLEQIALGVEGDETGDELLVIGSM